MPAKPPSQLGQIPWFVVIALLIFFWPAGLLLLVLKLHADRSSQLIVGGLLSGAGMLLVIATGMLMLTLSAMAADGDGDAGYGICCVGMFFVLGAFLWRIGSRLRRFAGLTRRLIPLIVNQRQHDLKRLAMLADFREVGVLTTQVQKMIDEGFLPGYSIDYDRMRLRVSDPDDSARPGRAEPSSEGSGDWAVFDCRSCGANNAIRRVRGEPIRCDYCGTAQDSRRRR